MFRKIFGKSCSYDNGIKVDKDSFVSLEADKRAGILFDCLQSILWNTQKQWYILLFIMAMLIFKEYLPIDFVKKAIASYF